MTLPETHQLLTRVLDGRQAWYECKIAHLAAAPSATWMELGLNVPGWPKHLEWTDRVFAEGCRRLVEQLDAQPVAKLRGDAGRFALFRCPLSARVAKRRAVELEQAHPWGRLWDIDCRGPGGPITRRALGLSERPCLACHRPHETCIGSGRHSLADVRRRAGAIAARPHIAQRAKAGHHRSTP